MSVDGGALGISGNEETMNVEILNCTFSNCVSQAVFGQSVADSCNSTMLSPVIKNCIFSTTSNACVIEMTGGDCADEYYTYAFAQLDICANIFQNLTGCAFLMTIGNAAFLESGQATFMNNTIVSCVGGVGAVDPWNATIQNNIFMQVTNAVTDTGSLTRTVGYNDFYENATNFTGYNGNYGQWIIPNRNGTIADVLLQHLPKPFVPGHK